MKLGKHITNTELKPTKIPEDFVLIIDTREGLPLFKDADLPVIHKALKHGDYSIRGFENTITIERKKLSDFYSYISSEMSEKTVPKMKAMVDYSYVGLVIEASESDVLSPQLYTNVSPELARSFLASWEVRYGFHVYYSRSRKDIERWILDRLTKFWKVIREV